MTTQLKSMLNNVINDHLEEAQLDLHNYLTLKMREVVGLLENFGALQKADDKDFHIADPKAGPALIAYYKGDKGSAVLALGVDPDDEEGKIRVRIDTASNGSSRIKAFDNDEAGYKEALKYANSLRTAKVKLT